MQSDRMQYVCSLQAVAKSKLKVQSMGKMGKEEKIKGCKVLNHFSVSCCDCEDVVELLIRPSGDEG